MSPPAISERIARLEAAGVIKGYRAILDWGALGRPMLVDISVLSERTADQREVAEWLIGIPEVESVDIITGSMDLRLRLRVRDPDHMRDVFYNRIFMTPGLRHTETSIVLESFEPANFSSTTLTTLISEKSADDEQASA